MQCWPRYANLNFDLNHYLTVNIWIFTVKFWTDCICGMDGPIDMKQEGYKSLDLIHDLDLGFWRLDFENNCIWGITWDITSVHGKHHFVIHLLYQVVVVTTGVTLETWPFLPQAFYFVSVVTAVALPYYDMGRRWRWSYYIKGISVSSDE